MQYDIKVFPNNLRSLTVYDSDSLSASIMLLVGVGSRFERKKISGIAHFVEHTIFKGTKKRPSPKRISMEVELMGAKMNAFTSKEYTGYYIKVPKEKFSKAIEILADMFKDSIFDVNEIEKERGVILEEKRMYEDQPMEKVAELFERKLFYNNKLAVPIIGEEKTIKNIKRQDFLSFINEYYHAGNTVVVVSGNIKPDVAFNLIEKHFLPLKYKAKAKIGKFNKYKLQKKIYNLYRPIEQSHIILGGFSLKRDHKDRFILNVLNTILGRGFASRLFKTIRDDLGLAYYIYSSLQEYFDVGTFMIGMGVRSNQIDKAVFATLKQIDDIISGNFSNKELLRAKNYLIGSLTIDLETSDELALWYGKQLLLNKEILSIENVKQKILDVSKNDILDVGKKIFKDDNFMLAGVTPHKSIEFNF